MWQYSIRVYAACGHKCFLCSSLHFCWGGGGGGGGGGRWDIDGEMGCENRDIVLHPVNNAIKGLANLTAPRSMIWWWGRCGGADVLYNAIVAGLENGPHYWYSMGWHGLQERFAVLQNCMYMEAKTRYGVCTKELRGEGPGYDSA